MCFLPLGLKRLFKTVFLNPNLPSHLLNSKSGGSVDGRNETFSSDFAPVEGLHDNAG